MNGTLKQTLDKPMKALSDVRNCFYYCETVDDIREVIRAIPSEFGEFEIQKVSEREGYFTIQNFFEVDGEAKARIMAYDFYTTKN